MPYWNVHPAVIASRPMSRMSHRRPERSGGGEAAADSLASGALLIW
jgi:hypothetical protein